MSRAWIVALALSALILGGAWWSATRLAEAREDVRRADAAADALAATLGQTEAARMRAHQVADSLRSVAARHDSTARRYAASAAHLGARAELLADSARTLGDTLGAAWAAYEAADARGDTLEMALVATDSARVADHARVAWFAAALDSVDTSWRRTVADLRASIPTPDPPCRVGPFPCPSRTATATAGFLLGVVGGVTLTRD